MALKIVDVFVELMLMVMLRLEYRTCFLTRSNVHAVQLEHIKPTAQERNPRRAESASS